MIDSSTDGPFRRSPSDIIVSPGSLELGSEFDDLRATARRMGLLAAEESTITWRGERVERSMADIGRRLLERLQLDMDGVWPSSALTPPAPAPDLGPSHRLWMPLRAADWLPWEAACEPSGFEIFCDTRFSLTYSHRLRPSSVSVVKRRPGPLKVLVASAMPHGVPSANVELQRLAMDRLDQAPGGGRFRWFAHHDLSVLRNTLRDGRYNSLHVVAHGLPGRILWFDERSRPVWYSAHEFIDALAGLPSLTSVLWMVCYSGSAPTGVSSLLRAGLDRLCDSAIAMRSAVDDATAVHFVRGYYAALLSADEISIETAVTSGRSAVLQACRANETPPGQWVNPMVAFRDQPVVIGPSTHAVRPDPEPTRKSLAGSTDRPPLGCLVSNGERYVMSTPTVRIGRSTAADVVTTSAETAPFHAALEFRGDHWSVLDERTGRLTLINGQPVGEGVLRAGDTLTIGDQDFVLSGVPADE